MYINNSISFPIAYTLYTINFISDSIETCHVSGGPLKPLWSLQLPPPNVNYIKFSVRLCKRGVITFRITNGTSYRIWLDALKLNTTNQHLSCFTELEPKNGVYVCISTAYPTPVLDCTEFRQFWISWEDSKVISIGKGLDLEKQVMISLKSGYIPVSTSFEFGGTLHDSQYIASVWRFVRPPTTSGLCVCVCLYVCYIEIEGYITLLFGVFYVV